MPRKNESLDKLLELVKPIDRPVLLSALNIYRAIRCVRQNVPSDHMRLLLLQIMKVRIRQHGSDKHRERIGAYAPLSFTQMGEVFGITFERVRQILKDTEGLTGGMWHKALGFRPRRYMGHKREVSRFYADRPKCPFCERPLSVRRLRSTDVTHLHCRSCGVTWGRRKDDPSLWGGGGRQGVSKAKKKGGVIRWNMTAD